MTQHGHASDDDAGHAGDNPTSRQSYEYEVAYDAWLKENPIRRLRLEQQVWSRNRSRPMSQNLLANRLRPRRAPLTIQNWESGAVTPKDEGFASLAEFFGDSNIKEEWLNWRRRQPQSPIPHLIQAEMAAEDTTN